MESWLEFARGPLFYFALAIMLLGLLRHIVYTVINLARMQLRADDHHFNWRDIARQTLAWLLPVSKLRNRGIYSAISILFHIGIILTPLLLAAHIALWERGLGIAWPALSDGAADALTLLAIVAGVALFIGRVGSCDARALSRFQDYVLPPLLLVPFISGYLAMHPAINPFAYTGTMLVHVLSANLIMVLIPFTKLSHMVLMPAGQVMAEAVWKMAPDAGDEVLKTLEMEGEPV